MNRLRPTRVIRGYTRPPEREGKCIVDEEHLPVSKRIWS